MSQSNKSVSPLRQRMIDDMTLRKLSDKTQIQYIRAVKRCTDPYVFVCYAHDDNDVVPFVIEIELQVEAEVH